MVDRCPCCGRLAQYVPRSLCRTGGISKIYFYPHYADSKELILCRNVSKSDLEGVNYETEKNESAV